MPVLINNSTGLAEDLPEHEANPAVRSGSHAVPLNDPEGNPVNASFQDVQGLLSQGYTQPSTNQLKSLMDYAHYSSTPEQIKTALEGYGVGLTGGLSTLAETGLGISTPESILGRSETNPWVHGLAQGPGFATAAALGMGPAAIAERLELEAGKRLLPIAAEHLAPALIKVGSAAAKQATEFAVMQAGDEASKAFVNDPHQSLETALINIGLSGAFGSVVGGGMGSISPIWEATKGSSVGKFLQTITDKANGLERDTLPKPKITAAAKNVGVELAPEMNAALSENPEARADFQSLQEANTPAGKEAQLSLDTFKENSNKALVTALGKTPEDLESLKNFSQAEEGNNLRDNLVSELKQQGEPLSESFEKVKSKYLDVPLEPSSRISLSNQFGQLMIEGKYNLLEGTADEALINKAQNAIPKVENLNDLVQLQSRLRREMKSSNAFDAGGKILSILRNEEGNIIESQIGQELPEVAQVHKAARSSYYNFMNQIDDLASRLKISDYEGPGTFLNALSDMKPEDVLKNLSQKNDVNLLNTLSQSFPKTASALKENFIDQTLKKSVQTANQGFSMNPKTFLDEINKWSPELKKFVLSDEAASKINDVSSLLEKIPKKMNTSGTAKTLDSLWSKMAAGTIGMIGSLTGHNPAISYILGHIGSTILGKNIPDAIKLATLKFLGSNVPISSPGFKALAELASNSIKGQQMKMQAIKSIFSEGSSAALKSIPSNIAVKEDQREKLQKKLDYYDQHPEAALDLGGQMAHYAPEHAEAFGAVAMRAFNYLKSIQPNTTPQGILDPKPVVSNTEKQKYNEAMDVINQPLTILHQISNNQLTPDSLKAFQAVYPSSYQDFSQKIMEELNNHVSEGNSVPYDKRMMLSLFLGQPLDSTMSPSSIQSAQTSFVPPQNNSSPPPTGGKKGGHSMKALEKVSSPYQTPLQARASDKINP